MEKGQKKKSLRQWHPAFYAGIQIEFSGEADKLCFENEHQPGTRPKAVDVLIIKKDTDVVIHKNIGQIFRTHNIVEYKRPGDYLSIDDYYKVLGKLEKRFGLTALEAQGYFEQFTVANVVSM